MNMPPTQSNPPPPSIQDDPEAMAAIQLLMERGYAQQACQMLEPQESSEDTGEESAEGAVDNYLSGKQSIPDDGD